MTDRWAIRARLLGTRETTWLWGDREIQGVADTPPDSAIRLTGGGVISPTLCDTHTHGAMGLEVEANPDTLDRLLTLYATRGVGVVQLSTITLPPGDIREILSAVRRVQSAGAKLIGVHLEGPFLSPEKKGAHDPSLLLPGTLAAVQELIEPALDVVSSVTVDPVTTELDAIRWLVSQGVTVAIGHTPATYEQAAKAFEAGATVVTHAFNAMLPISSREPGPVLAALDQGAWIEVIADGHHVHPSLIRLLCDQAPDRVVLVSDSMSATGLDDGDYSLGSVKVVMADGIARTVDGSLAGSTLSLHETVAHLVRWGVGIDTALVAATSNPRQAYGTETPGLSVGSPADFLVWSDSGELTHIVRDGVITPAGALSA